MTVTGEYELAIACVIFSLHMLLSHCFMPYNENNRCVSLLKPYKLYSFEFPVRVSVLLTRNVNILKSGNISQTTLR